MPLEIELLLAAWDNVKKNLLVDEDMEIDPETGEIIEGTMAASEPDKADLFADLDELMYDIAEHYREAAETDALVEF
jgi:hypothetical protein